MIERLAMQGLLKGGWRELSFSPFHPGVEIHRFYGQGDGAAAALLRYRPGSAVPLHEHVGFEHVLILDGAQEDERGRYGVGSFAINPPGTRHRVWSVEGCVAMLIWERPVRILS